MERTLPPFRFGFYSEIASKLETVPEGTQEDRQRRIDPLLERHIERT